MVDTNDEWIVSRTGIRERRVAGPGETTATMAAVAGLAGDRNRGTPAGRHRSHHRRHAHSGLPDAVDGRPGQGGDRKQAGRRDGPGRGMLRFRVRLRDRARLHRQRHGPPRSGHRGRDAEPLHGLHRPKHLHPVRRWRRGGGPLRLGRARRHDGHRTHDRAVRGVPDLAAGRRRVADRRATAHSPSTSTS